MLKNQELIQAMTLEEKASLLSGENFWNTKDVKRLGILSIMMTDGPHGLRKQGGGEDHLGLNSSIPATCFPTAATLANSWDEKLVYKVGELLGEETKAEDVQVILGPGLNIKRNPLCGRNFEYFSEDPYLTGKMAAAMIRGIQSTGVAACSKHYAVNSQEHLRMTINEIVDERSLREIYLEGFRYAVKEGKSKSIMTSYNKVNGDYANESHHLMQKILYEEWGFDGMVVTDWGGNHDRVAGLKAGNHLEMPSTGGITDKEVVEAVKSGALSEELLDRRVDELLSFIFEVKETTKKKNLVDHKEHHIEAVDAALKSIVLLKNDDKILPLKSGRSVALIGDFASTPRYQGAGSSLIVPTYLDDAVSVFKETRLDVIGHEQGFKRYGGSSKTLLNKATKLAKEADITLVFIGLDESSEAEGVDRKHMRIPDNQLKLVHEMSKVNDNIVIILSGGSPMEVPFINEVKAIVHGYLGGQGGARAMVDVLLGEYNPSGKLSETYPIKYRDVPSSSYYPGLETTSEHREGIYIGYRYYDKVDKQVLFPFGYGLSYTSFEYSDLKVEENQVIFSIKNTGKIKGEEIAQVYVCSKNSLVFRAKKELKGFTKISLEPGETKEVTVILDRHAFAYYSIKKSDWFIEEGHYDILVGGSSRDIYLHDKIFVEGSKRENPYENMDVGLYEKGQVKKATHDDFSRLLNKKLPLDRWNRKKALGMNDTIGQSRYKSIFGKFLYGITFGTHKILMIMGKPLKANNVFFVINMPFRQLSRFSKGKFSIGMTKKFLNIINFKLFK